MSTAGPAFEPEVGIFWGIPNREGHRTLIIDSVPIAEGEVYGEFITHPRGHYTVWEQWRKARPGALAKAGLPSEILWNEYEWFPRGRVVYHRPSERFTIYADRKLQSKDTLSLIVGAFNLQRRVFEVRSDQHYVSDPGN